jgi:predicted nuclease of restriction endonuclease-like (RecB) superfamily
MTKPQRTTAVKKPDALFDRVVSILEQARGNVVRAVNTNMVMAYWLIGREIVLGVQGGERRAEYGKRIVEELAARLTERFGQGFSRRNLLLFKQFYLSFDGRCEIVRPSGAQSGATAKPRPAGAQSSAPTIFYPMGRKSPELAIPHPTGTELSPCRKKASPAGDESPQGFLPPTHLVTLPRPDAGGQRRRPRLSTRARPLAGALVTSCTLERQIHSLSTTSASLAKSREPEKLLAEGREQLDGWPRAPAAEALKHPYVLEFLGLPEVAAFHESDLERAIITHLQRFLLELGSGFAFVARQKHVRLEEQDRYIDLVFYHCRLKFYLLIDLKVGELTHADVGQMDGYVRMHDGMFTAPDDNPTIGLILCTEKNETVARYSVLNDRKQIFASKYMLCLPTEEQLRREIERERR